MKDEKKRFISVLLSTVIVLGSLLILPLSASAVTEADYKYKVENSSVKITEYIGTDKAVEIPSEIDGKKVTSIGKHAFSEKDITELTIPDGVKKIEDEAFTFCKQLKKVVIPDSVEKIGDAAFEYDEKLCDINIPSNLKEIPYNFIFCTAVGEIKIPDSVKKIASYAFSNTKLKRIEIPDSVTTIGDRAFAYCKKLTYVKLSANIKKIPSEVFRSDSSLESVKIPDSVVSFESAAFYKSGIKIISIGKNVKSISEYAFLKMPNLGGFKVSARNKNYSAENGVLYNKKQDTLLSYPDAKSAERFTVGKKVKEIGRYAFSYSLNLKKVKLSKGVKIIGASAFRESSITGVSFPSTLKTISANAFHSSKLKSVSIPKSVTKINSKAFSNCKSLKTLKFKGSSKLKLSYGIFRYCTALKKVNMPQAKKEYGWTFSGCTSLKKVTFSGKIKTIAFQDFSDCNSLKSVTVPKSVTKIEKEALGYVNDYPRKSFTIKGVKNSAAHKYAKKNKLKFIAV